MTREKSLNWKGGKLRFYIGLSPHPPLFLKVFLVCVSTSSIHDVLYPCESKQSNLDWPFFHPLQAPPKTTTLRPPEVVESGEAWRKHSWEDLDVSKNRGKPPQIIHLFHEIFTIHFGGQIPLFLVQHPSGGVLVFLVSWCP